MTSDDPISEESLEQLRRLAAMPDDQIDTSDIPERTFNLELAARRKREGWRPGGADLHKKAS